MAEQGVPNKRFSEQMRHHRKAWDDPSSEEYRLRKSYPGKEAREWVCENDDCINFMPYPSHETYWLCPECARVAPSIIDYYTHAPYKVSRAFIPPPGWNPLLPPVIYSVGPPQVLPPKKKQQAASASAFAVWAKNRPRPPRLTEAEVPTDGAQQEVPTDAPVAGIEGPESGPESPSGAGECRRAAAGPPNATR